MNFIKNFIAEEDGITAIEYALMAALVAAAIIAGVVTLKKGLGDAFTNISSTLTTNSK